MSNGFIPTGTGPKGQRFGKDTVTGRAFKQDGSVRKQRVTKTPQERLAANREEERKAYAGIGRQLLANVATLALFVANIGTFKRWKREAVQYGTPEARQKRREYHEAALAAIDARGEAAEDWLANMGDAIEQANGIFSSVGEAYDVFHRENDRVADEDELAAMVAECIDADAIEAVAGAANPENDPFVAFRREAVEESDSSDEDEDDDTL